MDDWPPRRTAGSYSLEERTGVCCPTSSRACCAGRASTKVVIFRTWIATKIADAEPLLNDIDVFLRSASTYISV
eukprot:6250593-Prymnesium_polylepis.1